MIKLQSSRFSAAFYVPQNCVTKLCDLHNNSTDAIEKLEKY